MKWVSQAEGQSSHFVASSVYSSFADRQSIVCLILPRVYLIELYQYKT